MRLNNDSENYDDREWPTDFEATTWNGLPYPCPADWVLNIVEGDGIIWYRYPGIGEGLESDTDVLDVFEDDHDAYNDARDEMATLSNDAVLTDQGKVTESIEHELTIAGETVFRRVDPDHDDLMATVAEALLRYSNDQDFGDLEPSTGRLPADLRRQQELERRSAENESLAAFANREGDSA